MGWSGTGILHGDEPMEFEHDIASMCGYDYNNEKQKSGDFLTKKNLEKFQLKIIASWKKNKETSEIAGQVLAYYMVKLGCKFEPSVLKKCILALEVDEWSKTNAERKYHINYLLDVLKSYKNKPTSPEDKNLYYNYKKGKTADYFMYVQSILKKLLNDKPYLVVKKGIAFKSYDRCILVMVKSPVDNWDSFSKWYQSDEGITSLFDVGIVYY